MGSPDLAQELAAHALLACGAVGHDAAARRKDRDAHAAANARDPVEANVHATAGGRHATNAVDRRVLLAVVPEHEREGLGALSFALADFVDEAFRLQDV